MNHPLPLAVLAAFAFLPFPAATSPPVIVPAPDEQELQYPVDPDALRAEFRASGSFTLRVPVLGAIRIVGQENELTSHGGRRLDTPSIHVLGSVAGHANSTANILLGEYGVYGSADIPVPGYGREVRFRFNAVQVAEGYELQVTLGAGSFPPASLRGDLWDPAS